MKSNILIIALLAAGSAHADVKVGDAAPAFTLKDETGRTHKLSQYRGKVVVLEWTNPQCPFVKRHYRKQTMTRTARAFEHKVVWLAVNSSHFNRPEDSRRWSKRKRLPFRTLQDPGGAVGRSYGARATPHMFVIDRKGVLRYAGAIDNDPHGDKESPTNHVRAAIGNIVAGRSPTPAATRPYGCSVKYKRR